MDLSPLATGMGFIGYGIALVVFVDRRINSTTKDLQTKASCNLIHALVLQQHEAIKTEIKNIPLLLAQDDIFKRVIRNEFNGALLSHGCAVNKNETKTVHR